MIPTFHWSFSTAQARDPGFVSVFGKPASQLDRALALGVSSFVNPVQVQHNWASATWAPPVCRCARACFGMRPPCLLRGRKILKRPHSRRHVASLSETTSPRLTKRFHRKEIHLGSDKPRHLFDAASADSHGGAHLQQPGPCCFMLRLRHWVCGC